MGPMGPPPGPMGMGPPGGPMMGPGYGGWGPQWGPGREKKLVYFAFILHSLIILHVETLVNLNALLVTC